MFGKKCGKYEKKYIENKGNNMSITVNLYYIGTNGIWMRRNRDFYSKIYKGYIHEF